MRSPVRGEQGNADSCYYLVTYSHVASQLLWLSVPWTSPTAPADGDRKRTSGKLSDTTDQVIENFSAFIANGLSFILTAVYVVYDASIASFFPLSAYSSELVSRHRYPLVASHSI